MSVVANSRAGGVRGVLSAFAIALNWRALVLWWASLTLVSLMAVAPFFVVLDAQLSHTVDAARYAKSLDLVAFGDVMRALSNTSSPQTGVVATSFAAALLWPWLTGVMVAAVRLERRAPILELAAEGMREYGRQLRLVLWSVVTLSPLVALGVGLVHLAHTVSTEAILPSAAEWAMRASVIVTALMLVLVYMATELARARIAALDDTRSAVKAWWRAVVFYVCNPLRVFGVLILVAALSAAVLLLLAALRIRVSGPGSASFVLALILNQVITALIGWLRLARLQAFANLISAGGQMQGPSGHVPNVRP